MASLVTSHVNCTGQFPQDHCSLPEQLARLLVPTTPYLLLPSYKEMITPPHLVCHFARLLSNWKNFHSPSRPLTPSLKPSYSSRTLFLVFRGSSDPEVPRSVLGLPAQISGAGQDAPVPPQAIQGLHGSHSPKTRSPLAPQEPSSLRQQPFSGGPQPPPCHSSTHDSARSCHTGPRPPSVSHLPQTRATPSFPTPPPPALSSWPLPGFPGSPSPSNPSCPGHSRVTPFSGQVITGHPPVWDPGRSCLSRDLSHTHRPRSVSQTEAALRPKGPPGLTRLGPVPAYLADANSAAGSRAILPPAQSARTRRRRPRLRPGPGPTRPAVQGPVLWPPPPERRAGVLRPATASRPQGRVTGTHLPLPPTNSSATASTSAASSHQAPPPPPWQQAHPVLYFLSPHWTMGQRLSVLIGLVYLSVLALLPPLFLDPVSAPARSWSDPDQALVAIGWWLDSLQLW